jgi:hypothetical protein
MSTPHLLHRTHHHTNNLARAELLQAAAIDQMYTFQIGTRPVTVHDVSDDLTVNGRFSSHHWGCSIQLWARNKHGKIQASAESSVIIDDQRGGYIASRIKQFRTGELLWTHTAEPVNQHRIDSADRDTYLASGPELVYQLSKHYDLDSAEGVTPIWTLTCPGSYFVPVQLPTLTASFDYITAHLPGANK